MTILSRHLLTRYAGALAAFFMLFTSLFILIEVFDLRRGQTVESDTVGYIGRYILLRIPFQAYFALPVSVLVASVFITAWKATLSETIAARAAGVSKIQYIAPLLYVSGFVTLLLLIGTQWKIPEWCEEADTIRRVKILRRAPPSRDYLKLAFLTKGRYILADHFSPVSGIMKGITLMIPDADHATLALTEKIAESAWLGDAGWSDTLTRDMPPPTVIELIATSSGFIPLTERPAEAVSISTLAREYGMLWSLRSRVESSERISAEMARRMVKVGVKLAFPLVVPFLAVLGATVGMAMGRRRGIMHAMTGALGWILAYLILLQIAVRIGDVAANTPRLQPIAGLIPCTIPLLIGAVAIFRFRRL